MDVSKYYNLLIDKVVKWSEKLVEMVPNFVLAIVVFFVFIFIAKFVKKLLDRLLKHTTKRHVLNNLIVIIINIAIILIGVFAALSVLNLEKTVTSLLAGAGILGLALGFAFKDIATNFIAGFFMAIHRPFKIGDVIHCEGNSGIVKRISIRTTEIASFKVKKL